MSYLLHSLCAYSNRKCDTRAEKLLLYAMELTYFVQALSFPSEVTVLSTNPLYHLPLRLPLTIISQFRHDQNTVHRHVSSTQDLRSQHLRTVIKMRRSPIAPALSHVRITCILKLDQKPG